MSHKQRALKLLFLEWIEELLEGTDYRIGGTENGTWADHVVDLDGLRENIRKLREQITKELPPLTVDFFEDFKS